MKNQILFLRVLRVFRVLSICSTLLSWRRISIIFATSWAICFTTFAGIGKNGIVFLSVDGMGSGHLKIAEAIEHATKARADLLRAQGLESIGVSEKVVLLNDFMTPEMKNLFGRQYLQFAQNHPFLNELIYTHLSKLTTLEIRNLINSAFISKALAQALMEDSPIEIVSFNALEAQMVDAMKLKGWIPQQVKSTQVVTDNAVTPIYNSPGLVILPHPNLVDEMVDLGKDPAWIEYVHGIPSGPQFHSPYEQALVRAELNATLGNVLRSEIDDPQILSKMNLNAPLGTNETVVFASGGGEGIGLDQFLDFVPNWNPNESVIVLLVCGKNASAYRKSLELIKSGKLSQKISLVPRPFVRDGMDALQKASHFAVGKPGGSATAEAIALRLPYFVFTSLAAQEKRNLEFLTKRGVIAMLKLPELNDITAMKHKSAQIKLAQSREYPNPGLIPDEVAKIIIDHALHGSKPDTEKFTNVLPKPLAIFCRYLLTRGQTQR